MEGGFGGVGRFRDLGDYRDKRRTLGAVPLQAGDPRIGTTLTPMELLLLGDIENARIQDPAVSTGYDSDYLATRAEIRGKAGKTRDKAGVRPNIRAEELQLMQAIARDPEAEYAASLYPARVSLDSRVENEILQDYLRKALPQEQGVRAERRRDIADGDFNEEKAPGGFIGREFKDDIAPYGSVSVPMRNRYDKTFEREVYPSTLSRTDFGDEDSTAAFDRYNELSLGDIINEAQEGSKTPLIGRPELVKLYKEGQFEYSRDRKQIGFLRRGDQAIPVFEIGTGDGGVKEDIFRLGDPTARNYEKLRKDIADRRLNEGNPLSTRITGRVGIRKGTPVRGTEGAPASIRQTEIKNPIETGAVAFLNRDDVYKKIGGLRRNVENAFPDSDGKPVSLNDLLNQLSAGAYMDSPDVGNVYRRLAILEDRAGRPLFEPGTAGAEGIRRARVEASGVAQGREVDMFAEDPNLADYPDSPSELYVVDDPRGVVDQDITGTSTGDRTNSGYGVISPNQAPSEYKTATAEAQSGPVVTSLGHKRNFSGAEAQAVRAAYQNPDLAGILRATSQPEIDITNDRIQQAFDERLALLGQKQREQVAPDTGTAMNAPASTGSVTEQQALLDSVPTAARQNIERGLSEGASDASRRGALEFLARARKTFFR